MSYIIYEGPHLAHTTGIVISCRLFIFLQIIFLNLWKNYVFMLCWNPFSTFFKSMLSLKVQLSFFLMKMSNIFLFLFCTLIKTVFCKLLYFTVKYCPVCLLSFPFPLVFLLFFISFLFPWWKLNEASPSATVLICMKLCPLLKAFLCCSTLWALSCLVFLLVTLLALTDSQVNCTLRAACFLCVCLLHLWWRHFTSFRFCLRLFLGTKLVNESDSFLW